MNYGNNGREREVSIDILKIVACFSVIALHYTVYFYEPCANFGTYIALHSFHWFAFGCIGYFILATGYLNCYKEINKKYFIKIIPIIVVFFVYSVLTHIIISPFDGSQPFLEWLHSGIKWYFWDTKGYNWYMNFYIAFYFIIPFFNVLLNNISRRQHELFIVVSVLILSLPGFISELGAFVPPITDSGITLPSYFSPDCFPFIYYAIGVYIRKYGCYITKKLKTGGGVFAIGVLVIHSLFDWWYLQKYQTLIEVGQHVWSFNTYGNIFTIASCTMLLICLSGMKIVHKRIKSVIAFLSSHTLEMYLGLTVADTWITKICERCNYTINASFGGFLVWFCGEIAITFIGAVIITWGRILVKKIVNIISAVFGVA